MGKLFALAVGLSVAVALLPLISAPVAWHTLLTGLVIALVYGALAYVIMGDN